MDYDCTAATSATGTIAGCPGGVGGGVGTAAAPYIVDLRYPLGTFSNSVGQIDPTSTNGWFFTQYRNTPVFNYTSFRIGQPARRLEGQRRADLGRRL